MGGHEQHPEESPRESVEKARESAEETVQKLDELRERLDTESTESFDSDDAIEHDAFDGGADGGADYDGEFGSGGAPLADIDRGSDTGHAGGGPRT